MRQYTESYTVLEMRELRQNKWSVWHKPLAAMYRPAEMLAYQNRIIESIETAQEIRIQEYGEMHGIQFRCVTKSTIVSVNTALHEGWKTI
jgi:hypothetical protein